LHRVVEKLQAHLRKLGIHQVMRKKALSDNIGTTNWSYLLWPWVLCSQWYWLSTVDMDVDSSPWIRVRYSNWIRYRI